MVLIDYQKTPIQNVLAVINASSSVVFEETHLTYGSPLPISEALPGKPNTLIIITATEDSPVSGSTTSKYRRINIDDDFADYTDTFQFALGTSDIDVLQSITDAYALHPDSTFTLTSAPNGKKLFKPLDSDLLYCGERLITVTFV